MTALPARTADRLRRRLTATLQPLSALDTARLVHIRGSVNPDNLRHAVELLSTADEPAEVVRSGTPVADAQRYVIESIDVAGPTRTRLYQLGVDEHYLLIAAAPATTDHAGMAELAGQLLAALTGTVAPEAEATAGAPALSGAAGSDEDVDWAYWRERLAGELPVLALGDDESGRTWPDLHPSRHWEFTAQPSRAQRWRAFADHLRADDDVVALVAVSLLLRRYLGCGDIVLALAVAGPAGQLGTTVPLRLDLSGDVDLPALVTHVRERRDEALAHRRLAGAELARRLNPPRQLWRNQLDQVRIVLDTLVLARPARALTSAEEFIGLVALGLTGPPLRTGPPGGVWLRPVALPGCSVAGEMSLTLALRNPVPRLGVATRRGLPARLPLAFGHDLGSLVDDLVSGIAPRGLLSASRAVATRAPRPRAAHRPAAGSDPLPDMASAATIAERFAATADRYAEQPALVTDDGSYRYGELAALAGGYAAAIAAAGAERGDRVGLHVEHGVAAVAAMLGTLAVGAAYVPLDRSYPPSRLAYMREQARLTVIVSQGGLAKDGEAEVRAEDIRPAPYRPVATDPAEPAYLLFTSGSSGPPKAVIQTHRGVLATITNHVNNFGISPADRLSAVASFGSDMSVCDMYGALLSGATLVTIDVRRHGLTHLVRRLRDQRVSVYHCTPTLFRYLVDALGPRGRLPAVRAVLLGGEEATALDVLQARRHFGSGCTVVNGYGATEATFAAQYHIDPGRRVHDGPLPVGHPLPGYEIVLHDSAGRPAVLVGELVIRSQYVARGYWRDATLTAQRFGTDADGQRWYRTGDLARRLPDGRLVYRGRLDRQVKIRGYRVELGGIEARLAAQPGVVRAVAFARPSAHGEPHLYAYAHVANTSTVDGDVLRAALARELAPAEVPRAIVVTSTLPLTVTGKVDVAALATPAVPPPAGPLPVTSTERIIAAAWRRVLGVDDIHTDQNFFDLGGHSLSLAAVAAQLTEELGHRVPLMALFAHPTIGTLAAALDADPDHLDGRMPSADLARVQQRLARRREARPRHPAREPGALRGQ